MRNGTESAGRFAQSPWLLAAAVLTAATLLGGCEGLVVLIRPDPVEKAKFTLSRAPLLVLVEETPGAAPQPDIRHHLVRRLNTELRDQKVNTQVVPERDVQRVQRTYPQSGRWSEAELGRHLSAEQVLHVELDPYVLPRDAIDPTARSRLSARVRVVDTASGDQLWPLERIGHETVFELATREIHTASAGPDLRETLASGLADRIAKLFYEHKISEREAFRRGAAEGRLP